jgi:LmbE family N-acetylglucosaminyl deacetylase
VTFVFLHAHPDDEAIFTGGTIARLSEAGHRVVVVYATAGELGRGAGPELAATRRAEAEDACRVLGVERVVFLDHHDSGLSDDPWDQPWGAFAGELVDEVADHLAAIVVGEQAAALITYDVGGIYAHPDHLHAHAVGAEAARLAGLPTWYEVTVDREYLHFVDTHVAAVAGRSISTFQDIGVTTVEIATTVDVRAVLAAKFGAIAAHRSQVEADPSLGAAASFAEVYGYEWFIRHGQETPLDGLGLVTAGPRRALAR